MKRGIKRAIFLAPPLAQAFYRILYGLRRRRALGRSSQGQDGEDAFIREYFGSDPGGGLRYIDIGANDPVLLSNSYLLYQSGWQGMTIEPIQSLHKLHRAWRPKDVALNVGLGKAEGEEDFIETVPHVYSSFSRETVDEYVSDGLAMVRRSYKLRIMTLESLLGRHPEFLDCHALLLDTEGYDATILGSIPWDRFRPRVVVTEESDNQGESPILLGNGYMPIERRRTNVIYERQ